MTINDKRAIYFLVALTVGVGATATFGSVIRGVVVSDVAPAPAVAPSIDSEPRGWRSPRFAATWLEPATTEPLAR